MRSILAILILLACFVGSAGAEEKAGGTAIHQGSQVAFDYTLTVDGKVVESSKGKVPLQYVQGDGKLILGLARQLEGMKAGEEKKIEVKPEEAYGNPVPKALKEIPASSLPKGMKPTVGMLLQGTDASGKRFPARVVEIKKDTVVIDLNHPLAGKTLLFDVKIVSVK